MMRCFDDDARPPFTVVDPMTYFPGQFEAVQENLRRHGLEPATVDFRVTTSAAAMAAASKRQESFAFILLDGSHKVLAVMADLRWARCPARGGILCLHDYSPSFPGVRLSVDRFLVRNPHYERLAAAGSLLAIRKLREGPTAEITPLDRAYSMMWHLPLQARRKLDKWRTRRKAVA